MDRVGVTSEGVYQAAAQIGASVGLTQRTKVRFRRPP